MKELYLNFTDENGVAKRVLVEGEKFAIGRTPDNDLQIPLSNLSRQHAKIERFADVFIISDCGSSNGSSLNYEPLESPVALKHGDKLNLGDALEIEIEIASEANKEAGNKASPAPALDDDEDDDSPVFVPENSNASANSASASGSGSSGSMWLLMLAPIFMVLILLGLGATILIVRSGGNTDIGKNDTDISTPDNIDFPENDSKTPDKKETPTPTASPISNSGENSTPITTPSVTPTSEPPVTPVTSNESEKVKVASAGFLRRIVKNDLQAFLLEKQVVVLTPKINQFKGSSALADNIKNAKSNSSKLAQLAESKNLMPQFLAVAALTKLGNQKGDVVTVATGMLENLSEIAKSFGNDSANDSLLIIAAYSSNTSGEKFQSIVGNLSTKIKNATPRNIRSIWVFKEHGKLSNSEFDYAIQFLAIGTITQNPKDFNVSAEALVF